MKGGCDASGNGSGGLPWEVYVSLAGLGLCLKFAAAVGTGASFSSRVLAFLSPVVFWFS